MMLNIALNNFKDIHSNIRGHDIMKPTPTMHYASEKSLKFTIPFAACLIPQIDNFMIILNILNIAKIQDVLRNLGVAS